MPDLEEQSSSRMISTSDTNLMLEHYFRVEVCDQKGNIVAFDGFSSKNDEVLGSHHHEPHEFVAQNLLDLIGLLHRDRYPMESDFVDFRNRARIDRELQNLSIARADDSVSKFVLRFESRDKFAYLMELTLPSTRTRSFSFLEITIGRRSSSLLPRISTSGLLCRSMTYGVKKIHKETRPEKMSLRHTDIEDPRYT